ncbi:MAG: DUF1778 domain-containing protein [Candidatus Obscuribacterales bacterium]
MATKDKKGERIESRLSAEAKQQIDYAADLQGVNRSDFVVAAAVEKAAAVIEQHKLIKLSIQDSQALAEAILNPPKPNAKAIAAARRYKKIMGA